MGEVVNMHFVFTLLFSTISLGKALPVRPLSNYQICGRDGTTYGNACDLSLKALNIPSLTFRNRLPNYYYQLRIEPKHPFEVIENGNKQLLRFKEEEEQERSGELSEAEPDDEPIPDSIEEELEPNSGEEQEEELESEFGPNLNTHNGGPNLLNISPISDVRDMMHSADILQSLAAVPFNFRREYQVQIQK